MQCFICDDCKPFSLYILVVVDSYFCKCVVENMDADDFGFGQPILRRRLRALKILYSILERRQR